MEGPRDSRRRIADERRGQRGHRDLALGANIKKPGLEAERDRQSSVDVGRAPDERLGDRAGPSEGTFEETFVGEDWISAGDDDDERPEDQCEEHGEYRHKNLVAPDRCLNPTCHVPLSPPARSPPEGRGREPFGRDASRNVEVSWRRRGGSTPP